MRREKFFEFLEAWGLALPGLMMFIACSIVIFCVFFLFSNRAIAITVTVLIIIAVSASLSFAQTRSLIKSFRLNREVKDKWEEYLVLKAYGREDIEMLEVNLSLAAYGLLSVFIFIVWQIGIFKALITIIYLGALPILLANIFSMALAEKIYAHPKSYLKKRVFPQSPARPNAD